MQKFIKEKIGDQDHQEFMQSLLNWRQKLEPVSIGLSDKDKLGKRTMAEGREGYARLISSIASAHVNSLAREHDPAELEGRLNYDSKLEQLRQQLMAITEMVTETQMANGMDIMRMVDLFSDNLHSSRKMNESLDSSLREVDEFNKRFGVQPGQNNSPAGNIA